MATDSDQRQSFIPYPTNRVVGTVADAISAKAAITALLDAGFKREGIDILHGEEGVHRLDLEGAEHGFLAQFQRTLLRTAAPVEEYKHLTRHVEDVKAGRFVIMVLAPKRERRMAAADILNAHGAEFVGFYGRWAWEGAPPDDAAGGESGAEAHAHAGRPEDVPRLFADAWNKRDPDALAALFDSNAEFVNVTGLWWHDRRSIREAHAYGLERIFSASTLKVDDVRVKPMSDTVAVVHAAMTLSGQTPIATVNRPGTRRTVCSFVVHQVGSGWMCASTHNTDVVPHMETNIVDDDGRFRAANYRTGHVS